MRFQCAIGISPHQMAISLVQAIQIIILDQTSVPGGSRQKVSDSIRPVVQNTGVAPRFFRGLRSRFADREWLRKGNPLPHFILGLVFDSSNCAYQRPENEHVADFRKLFERVPVLHRK